MPYDDPWLYDLRTAGFTDDVRFFVAEAARSTGSVLELGVGTGRVAIPVARLGRTVVGLDLDPDMLGRARERARTEKVRLLLVRACMTRFAFRRPFDTIYVAFASLHDLPGLEAWGRCFACVRAALRPGGRFIVDDRPPPSAGVRERELRDPARRLAIRCRHTLEVDAPARRARGETTYFLPGGPRTFPFEGSFAAPSEIRDLLEGAGLRVASILGSYAGEPYEEGAPRHIFVAERADASRCPLPPGEGGGERPRAAG